MTTTQSATVHLEYSGSSEQVHSYGVVALIYRQITNICLLHSHTVSKNAVRELFCWSIKIPNLIETITFKLENNSTVFLAIFFTLRFSCPWLSRLFIFVLVDILLNFFFCKLHKQVLIFVLQLLRSAKSEMLYIEQVFSKGERKTTRKKLVREDHRVILDVLAYKLSSTKAAATVHAENSASPAPSISIRIDFGWEIADVAVLQTNDNHYVPELVSYERRWCRVL